MIFAGRVLRAASGRGARLQAMAEKLCYKAGLALITLSGDRAARGWAAEVQRADRAERNLWLASEKLRDERRRANTLFTACSLALNLLMDGQRDRALEQLRLAVIAGRRKP